MNGDCRRDDVLQSTLSHVGRRLFVECIYMVWLIRGRDIGAAIIDDLTFDVHDSKICY